jgi:sortase (surface protein transpeptidase)
VRARVVWRVRIPAIHVSAAIVPSGVNRDGTIAVPSLADVQKVGWYEYGAVPGHPGPAVLMGHVDTLAGRAVFFRLYQIRRGELIDVQEGGPPLVFAVTSVREVSKRSFPASLFALNGPPVLYLVTCAGAFDYVTRHYEDNIIVTARLLTVPGKTPPARRDRVIGIACVSTVTSPQRRHINHNRRTTMRSHRPPRREPGLHATGLPRGAAAQG